MSSFETSATVGEQGELRMEGLPFAPGTQVNVTISSTTAAEVAEAEDLAQRRARMQELFRTVKGFRQSPKFSREEIYDRKCFR
jgi:hypothetical protein